MSRANNISTQLYCPKLLESTFVELSFNNRSNIVVACIYKHSKFSVPAADFNFSSLQFLIKLLELLLNEFNINLSEFESDNNDSAFVHTFSSNDTTIYFSAWPLPGESVGKIFKQSFEQYTNHKELKETIQSWWN